LASIKEEIKAGLIIIISLILLSGFIIVVGGSQFFERLDKYYINVMDAAGLEVGAQVKLGGVRIGRVLDIHAPKGPGQPITIEIGIKNGTILYKGTKALITQVGLVGDIYLLLSVDKTTKERFQVGETIPSEEQVQFARMMAKVQDLSKSIDRLISDVNKLFSQKNIKGIEKVIENTNRTVISAASTLDEIVSALKGITDKLELALNDIRGFVRDNKSEVSMVIKKARETLEKAGEDIEKAGEMINAFDGTAKTLSSTIDSTSKSVDKTIMSIDNTVKSVDQAIDLQSQNLDQLLNLMTRTTEDLHDLIQELKAKPWGLIYKEGKGREE
jgi:phospholipid/cholesterol/gamma-HCH transport system substrate-binding protein